MATNAQNLLRDLIAWHYSDDLRPLLKRTIELVGALVVVDLPADPILAREILIDIIEDFVD